MQCVCRMPFVNKLRFLHVLLFINGMLILILKVPKPIPAFNAICQGNGCNMVYWVQKG